MKYPWIAFLMLLVTGSLKIVCHDLTRFKADYSLVMVAIDEGGNEWVGIISCDALAHMENPTLGPEFFDKTWDDLRDTCKHFNTLDGMKVIGSRDESQTDEPLELKLFEPETCSYVPFISIKLDPKILYCKGMLIRTALLDGKEDITQIHKPSEIEMLSETLTMHDEFDKYVVPEECTKAIQVGQIKRLARKVGILLLYRYIAFKDLMSTFWDHMKTLIMRPADEEPQST